VIDVLHAVDLKGRARQARHRRGGSGKTGEFADVMRSVLVPPELD